MPSAGPFHSGSQGGHNEALSGAGHLHGWPGTAQQHASPTQLTMMSRPTAAFAGRSCSPGSHGGLAAELLQRRSPKRAARHSSPGHSRSRATRSSLLRHSMLSDDEECDAMADRLAGRRASSSPGRRAMSAMPSGKTVGRTGLHNTSTEDVALTSASNEAERQLSSRPAVQGTRTHFKPHGEVNLGLHRCCNCVLA